MWNVRLYYKTRLNTANTLDKGSLLETAQHKDVPALNVIDAQSLQSIQVKASRADVKDVEYVKLTDTESGDYFYYEAGIPTPSSKDVWNIPVVVDGVLTMGEMYDGVENIPFQDGIITRHHVAKADDKYGAYTEDDPWLIPSKELTMDVRKLYDDTTDDLHTIVESTIALDQQAQNYEARVYTDPTTGETVTVPTVKSVHTNTKVEWPGVGRHTYDTPGTEYFEYANADIQKAVGNVRGLGVESGILNSYILPDSDGVFPTSQTGEIYSIQGVQQETSSNLDFEYANVDNKRVLYGSLNTYALISVASGASASFKPEDIVDIDPSATAPLVVKITDPRPAGRPYYLFRYFKGEPSEYTFMNAVPGMDWANAPLVYTGKSGSTLDQINFNTAMKLASVGQGEAEYQNNMAPLRALAGQATNLGGAALSGLGGSSNAQSRLSAVHASERADLALSQAQDAYLKSVGTFNENYYANAHSAALLNSMQAGDNLQAALSQGASGSGIGALLAAPANLAMAGVDYFHNRQYLKERYSASIASERAQFATGQIAAPALNFPRSETLRDFIGNGVLVVRYRPQTSDVQKLDRILTMYGYKDTMPLVGGESVFHNRSKFNFVQVVGCSIGGNAPRWLREATAAQLEAGVRIWHQIPDRTAYNAGQNV